MPDRGAIAKVEGHLYPTPRADRVANDWRETILQRVDAKARKARHSNGRIRDARIQINVGLGFTKALNEAARRRGISRVGYLRRAVGAFLAADLDLDYADIMSTCPVPAPWTPQRAWVTAAGDDDGVGFGTWHVPAGQTGHSPADDLDADADDEAGGR